MSWLLNSAAMNIGVHVSLSVLVSQVLVLQLCLTLCHPTDHSSVHGILQARIVEWIAIPFSRGSSQPRGRTWVYCITGKFFTLWATREASLSQEVNGVLSKENTLFFCFVFSSLVCQAVLVWGWRWRWGYPTGLLIYSSACNPYFVHANPKKTISHSIPHRLDLLLPVSLHVSVERQKIHEINKQRNSKQWLLLWGK